MHERALSTDTTATHAPTEHSDELDAAEPGKDTLLAGSAVQLLADGSAPGEGRSDPVAIAAQGTSGAGSALPHLGAIQHAFGHHDVSGIKAHVGGAATDAARALGAEAYATGNHVAFARAPDLHTAAHEAAHVVQQRAGVQLKGGIGEAGDAYERNADEVADRVVAGRSAVDLLPAKATAGGGGAVQFLNGAVPQNFRVTNAAQNDDQCSVTTTLAWDSSTGNQGDLADVQSRELIIFSSNPAADVLAYGDPALLPPGMVVAGNVLTKRVGAMSAPGGSDTHSGAALGPKFTVGGVPNLRRAPWMLVGTQYYQSSQNNGVTWNNLAGPFVITRTMAPAGDGFALTISKVGPDCMVAAGPTPITIETSTARQQVSAARVDQTPEWNAVVQAWQAAGLVLTQLHQDVDDSTGTAITINYDYTAPGNPVPNDPNTLDPDARDQVLASARAAVGTIIHDAVRTIIHDALTGPSYPTQFRITIFRGGAGVQQQAFWTAGGIYRVLLRMDSLVNPAEWKRHSMAGRESEHGWTNKVDHQRHRYTKAVVTHEMGHMLHAFTSSDKFLTATMTPDQIPTIQNANPPDPLAAEKIHICNVNWRVMQALLAKDYKFKWNYALTNPGEVVAEVFTAAMRKQNVPRGLAAVYVAYGGIRSPDINATLQESFGGRIPNIAEPEDAVAIINAP